MVSVKITVDTTDLKELLSKMNSNDGAKAVARGLNDSIKQGRTIARKEVKSRYNVAPIELARLGRADLLPIKGATIGNLSAIMSASVRDSIRLSAFKGTTGGSVTLVRNKSGMQTRKGRKAIPINAGKGRTLVTVELVKGQRHTMKHAFVAKMKSGHIGVFGRAGGYRSSNFEFRTKRSTSFGSDTPIAELGSMTIHKTIANRSLESRVIAKMQIVAPERIKFWLMRSLKII